VIVSNRETSAGLPASYLDNSGRSDRLPGGVRRIEIDTPHGKFKVWTRRFGNNPRIKLLMLPRFVDEVEQVRVALGLDASNFFLLGHSWGGILAVEYALTHQRHLKGLVISNMMMSIPEYNQYAEKVLMPTMEPTVLAEIKRLERRTVLGGTARCPAVPDKHWE
jgi:proline iminopeptidase